MWVKKKVKNNNEIEFNENTFRNDFIKLLDVITIHCYRHLIAKDRSIYEYWMWLIIHITNAAFVIHVLLQGWNIFTTNPLLTTLYDTLYPMSKIPFPAIAICNHNRISRAAALDLAQQLDVRDPDEKHNFSYYEHHILHLGMLYDLGLDQEDQFSTTKFQTMLENYYADNSTDIFNVEGLMERLTPNCSSILIRCFWKSEDQNCFSENMLETRLTQYGPCCTFNYVLNLNDKQVKKPIYTDLTGQEMGLILVVNGLLNDYHYSISNTIGFNVQIFNPLEFPESASGGIVEKPVSLGMETFLRIHGYPVQSDTNVRRYSLNTRKCLFDDELPKKFGTNYRRSNCVIHCRIRSIIALCDCIPFFYSGKYFRNASNIKVNTCNLEHITCLSKYKVKWSTIVTKIERIEGLEKEMEESLYCPECLPSCSEIKYSVTKEELPLIPSRREGLGILNNNGNVSEICVIRIFFGQSTTWMFKQDVSLYWFEILSNFGGLIGFVSGMSIISCFEIIFFILKQFWKYVFVNFHKPKTNIEIIIYP